MKHYKLGLYALLLSFIWISCDSDDQAPVIELISPQENATFSLGQTMTVNANITDNKDLDFVVISLEGPNDSLILRKVELSENSVTISEDFVLDFDASGPISLSLNVVDDAGNDTQVDRSFDYTTSATGSVKFTIRLEYNGESLVMFQPYEYPDGKKIDFTRCSFYMANLKLGDKTINQIDFHNLTDAHADQTLAQDGYSWTIDNVPTGSYESLSFGIGVPEELNGMDPADFPSGHPLAKPAENWFSWMSYIFLKVEGNVDLDDDDDAETGVALHTGADDAYRTIDMDYSVNVNSGTTSSVELVFDIYHLFEGADGIFKIAENPQLHSLDQMDSVQEISDNLTGAFHK